MTSDAAEKDQHIYDIWRRVTETIIDAHLSWLRTQGLQLVAEGEVPSWMEEHGTWCDDDVSDVTVPSTRFVGHQPADEYDADVDLIMERVPEMVAALRYITSPTMARPGWADPAEWARDHAKESSVRVALVTCIQTARRALGESTEGADESGR